MTERSSRTVVVSEQTVRHQIHAVLTSWGTASDRADLVADVMTDTDLAGIDSHGIAMLPAYENLLITGDLDVDAVPVVVTERDAHATIDGQGGLGHVAAIQAVDIAADKAHERGTGVVAVRNSHHFGAVGHYVARAARRGLICLASSTTRIVAVVPSRGAVPRLGTNPLAFAAPTGAGWPLVLDMSTSTVASNKVRAYALRDTPLPVGWVRDGAGRAIVDASAARTQITSQSHGGLTPLGGTESMSDHKGYGLGIMVQILSATLCGAAFAPLRDSGATDDIGHFFLALDPSAFRQDGGFVRDLDALVDVLHSTPPTDPSRPVLVPGEPEEMTRRERRASGIPLPSTLIDEIEAICRRHHAPFVLADTASPRSS
ncbi:Ldh family oxidoreductase [Mycolicibacterium sp. 018/SC-01/001]|uniref:Ldh family oxidoreductase n=1 Tax=Mycolicibacterium sp. 018/SC-01/001 TaxID=2592069 RepID=UPI00117F7696|nr:Ldh family oxidoreductase [Mycolicibacterium sp. 018/SC-01/001]TRW80951.1 Ldh family oxidoreductase [Mycolicibacterium sp. 018/SC-01/001]